MGECVSFKAYLKRSGQEAEVRRFGIDSGAASSYVYLRSKIQTIFPSLQEQDDQFRIFWHDGDDFISIDTDEELVVALTNSVQPIRLHVHVTARPQNVAGNKFEPQVHPGVRCDGCDGEVSGFRYKCVTCRDFDLCAGCEGKGLHPEHIMVRMSAPIPSHMRSKFMRKMFSKPHKFIRHHGWNRGCEGWGMPPPPPPCFTRDGESQPAPGPRVGDMFDFSALMDFINSLGVEVDDKQPAEPKATASSQAQASSSAQASTSSGQASGSQKQASGTEPVPGAEYLTTFGQAIQAFLDPFGINVQFDVRPPMGNETTTPTTPAATTPAPAATTPAPAATTPAPAATTPAPTATTPAPTTPPAPAAVISPVATPAPAVATPVNTEQTTPVLAGGQLWDAMLRDNYGHPTRRNSDDWTLVNRESPTRGDEAMAVDADGAVHKPSVYPTLPTETLAASAPADPEYQRVQEAVEKIRAMGFSIDPNILKELLSNQDIASVLEMLLGGGNPAKK